MILAFTELTLLQKLSITPHIYASNNFNKRQKKIINNVTPYSIMITDSIQT